MIKTHTKFAKLLRPTGKAANELTTIKPTPWSPNVAEVRVKSNAIHSENIATKPLARLVNLDSITRHKNMVADVAADGKFAGSRHIGHQHTGDQT